MNPSPRRHRQSGFTLIEIMVVVVILGILLAVVVPKLMSRPDEARVVKAKQDILTMESALNLYKLDSGIYPSTDQGLTALVTKPTLNPVPRNWKSGGYLKQVPADPWGNDYQYLEPGTHNPDSFDLFTYGADGKPGGEGIDADIGNWAPETDAANNS